tara:strand:- start:1807 stop:2814 length:1008 start_codon:yes stop_codon:yes gene_type:complete
MLLMPKHEAWLRREIKVKRAAGTTQIEGAALDEAAVGQLVGRGPLRKYTADEQANIDALQAYEFVDFLSDQPDVPNDELVIRQLNRYFLSGAAETLTPGVYRKGQNTVSNFAPPNQGDVVALMRSFALWLRDDQDGIHPVVKAGMGHIHLVAIHPFWDGNGRTARSLSTLILQRSPFGFRKLLSLESYMFSIRQDYFTALEQTLGTRFSTEYDATPWLEFFTLALVAHVDSLVARLTDWHRMMQQVHERWGTKGGAQRQADAYAFAMQTGQITRSDYIEITGVSPVTASRDLAQLVGVGVLIPEGKTRRRVYYPVALGKEPKGVPPEEQLPLLAE